MRRPTSSLTNRLGNARYRSHARARPCAHLILGACTWAGQVSASPARGHAPIRVLTSTSGGVAQACMLAPSSTRGHAGREARNQRRAPAGMCDGPQVQRTRHHRRNLLATCSFLGSGTTSSFAGSPLERTHRLEVCSSNRGLAKPLNSGPSVSGRVVRCRRARIVIRCSVRPVFSPRLKLPGLALDSPFGEYSDERST